MDLPTTSVMPHSLPMDAVHRCGPPSTSSDRAPEGAWCACDGMAAASSEHRLQHGGWQHVVRRCSLGCIAWRKCRSEEFNADFRSSHCMCSAGVGGCMWGAVLGGRCEQAECFLMVHDAPAPSLMHLPTPPIVWHLKLQHPSMQCAAEHLETLDRAEPGHDAHVSARLQRARGQQLQQ